MGGPDWDSVCADVRLLGRHDNFCFARAVGVPTVELIAVQNSIGTTEPPQIRLRIPAG